MNINFHRRGFANNSSSTHSIIQMTDSDLPTVDDTGDTDFGWQDFILKDRNSKILYLITMLKSQLADWSNPEYVNEGIKSFLIKHVASELMGDVYDLSELSVALDENDIDHQSTFNFPLDYSNTYFTKDDVDGYPKVDMEFFFEFVDYIIDNDNIVIFGGNDNGDGCVGDEYTNEIDNDFLELIEFLSYSQYVLSKRDGDNWVLYNKNSGSEFSFSFNGDIDKVSTFPTLVDLKITDYCEHNCYHCYMGSSKEGLHSNEVISYIEGLKDVGVGTVAIGGGNPLLHPNIKDIVEYASSRMVTCITCNTVKTEKEFDTLKDVMRFADSVAVTCNSGWEVANTIAPFKAIKNIYHTKSKIYLQGILEMFSENGFKDYLEAAKAVGIINITLLGYKPVGRASNREKDDVTYDWIEIAKKYNIHLGIDADIAKRYKSLIDKHGIDKKYITEEGNRSMFVDAVTQKAYKDSYSSEKTNGISLQRTGYIFSLKDILISAYKGFKE